MVARITAEGLILKRQGDHIFVKVGKGAIRTIAHIWITEGETVEDFEDNLSLNSKAGVCVGSNGALKLY